MEYINFIDYLVSPEKIDGLLSNLKVNEDSEALIICLKDNLSLNSEIAIFGIEELKVILNSKRMELNI